MSHFFLREEYLLSAISASCSEKGILVYLFFLVIFNTVGEGAPFPAALQCQVDAWSEWSKPLIQLPGPKIRLICSPHIGDVSDIKLIRTDTTLDLSQKAEKV